MKNYIKAICNNMFARSEPSSQSIQLFAADTPREVLMQRPMMTLVRIICEQYGCVTRLMAYGDNAIDVLRQSARLPEVRKGGFDALLVQLLESKSGDAVRGVADDKKCFHLIGEACQDEDLTFDREISVTGTQFDEDDGEGGVVQSELMLFEVSALIGRISDLVFEEMCIHDTQHIDIGSRWTHTNGNFYTVIGIANSDTTHPDVYPVTIVYQGGNAKIWNRPLSRWSASMTKV